MPSKYGKISEHPDRDQIISKLLSGEPVRKVADWLKNKYPDNKSKQIPFTTLDFFRRNSLNVEGNVLEDLKEQSRIEKVQDERAKLIKLVDKNSTYKKKKEEVLNKQIDLKEKLNGLLNAVEARFEQIYNLIQEAPEYYKPDFVLLQYIDKILHLVQDIRKIEGAPDQIIQHNITIQTIEKQTAIFQEAIYEALSELDLEVASLVIEKISSKLEKLKFEEQKVLFTNKDEELINKLTTNNAFIIEGDIIEKEDENA